MTLHIRQPGPSIEIEALVNAAFARPARHDVYLTYFKRLLDVVLVILAAPIGLLLVAACAVVVMKDGGSPFYSQQRVGRFGTTFKMWKLRSMMADADRALDQHLRANPEARAEWRTHQKLRNDPRITRFGRVLRKSSLDELPQLWNVFKGEMSLVGPRPIMENQRDIYPGSAYYAMRPGVTGLWQTATRNESSFVERASYDAQYLRKASLTQDVRVMLKTVGVVAKATGC